MTFPNASLAAPVLPAPASAAPLSPIDVDYRPGVCNIGPAEIARRRRTGITMSIATVVLLLALIVLDAPASLRAIVFLPAAVAASGFLQAWLRFCAGFGAIGVRNFGEVGVTDEIVDAVARARDRRRAIEIGLACAAVGGIVALIAVALPV